MFQFLNGTIKIAHVGYHAEYGRMFQFLNGTIKITVFFEESFPRYFVSIPQWYD